MSCRQAGDMGKRQQPPARHGEATPPPLWTLPTFSPSAMEHPCRADFGSQSTRTGCRGSLLSDKTPSWGSCSWGCTKGLCSIPILRAKGNQGRDGPRCCVLLHFIAFRHKEIKERLLTPASLTGLLAMLLSWQALGGGHGQRWAGSMGSDSERGCPSGWAGLQKGWQGCPHLPVPAFLQSLQWPGSILGEILLGAVLHASWPLLQPPYPTNRSPQAPDFLFLN